MVDLIRHPDDPIWRQYVPSLQELEVHDGIVDSLNVTDDPDGSVVDLYGHGTPVAGVMAARTNNGAPSSSSSDLICRLIAGWVRNNSSAAAEKLSEVARPLPCQRLRLLGVRVIDEAGLRELLEGKFVDALRACHIFRRDGCGWVG